MDQFNVLDIMNISTIDALDIDFNQWQLLPYDMRKKSDDICIQKYGCNNIQLYNVIKAKMLQFQSDDESIFESAVDTKIFLNKLKYTLTEAFNTGDQSKQEILGYMKNGMVNDKLSKIQLSKDYMKFEDDWVIICDFLDDKHPDYTLSDLNNMFTKYNGLNPEHRRLSDTYSIAIWGRPVFGMYTYMKQKFETLDAEKDNLEFVPDEQDQTITNYTRTIETEAGDNLQLLIRKLDCYNKSPMRSLYESTVLEQYGDKIKLRKKSYREDLPGVVPFLTYTEYLHNAKSQDQKKIARVDPFSYVMNAKHTAKALEEMYKNGETDKLLEFGWNPAVKPTREALEYAREKQIKWFDEHKLFEITDISNFEFLGEATEASTSSLSPLFLVIACNNLDKKDPKAVFGKKMGFKTLKDFNHLGISMEPNLENIYTFEDVSKEKLNKMKIVSIKDYKDSDMKIFVLTFFVKNTAKNTIKISLKNYMVNQDNTPYSFDNVMSIVKDKPSPNGVIPYIVIGQFLDSIFKISNLYDNIGKQKIGAGMNQYGGRFYVMFSGPADEYKENKVKNKIDGLKKIGTFSTLNFFGANNTVDENINPEDYGYYTFDVYLKKYTNESVNTVVTTIRDILNPENNEFKWIEDEIIVDKEDAYAKMREINSYCDSLTSTNDPSIIANILQKVKLGKSILLKIMKSLKGQDEQLVITSDALLAKIDTTIRYYDNYLKQFNTQPTDVVSDRIVIHDTNNKFKYSAENFKFGQ